MELLRERAGLTGGKRGRRRGDDGDDLDRAIARSEGEREGIMTRGMERAADAGASTLTSARGHINLFEDLERVRYCWSAPTSPGTQY